MTKAEDLEHAVSAWMDRWAELAPPAVQMYDVAIDEWRPATQQDFDLMLATMCDMATRLRLAGVVPPYRYVTK